MSDKPCTCHPDDNPPVPCPQKFALSECKAASAPDDARDAARYRWLRGDLCGDHSVRWMQWEVRRWNAPRWSDDLRREDLDSAIDAAMKDQP